MASRLYSDGDVTRSRLRRQFIRHNPTGQIWAVETLAGAVSGVVGPLGRLDIDPILLEHLSLDAHNVAWVTLHAGEFTQMDGQAFNVAFPPRKAPAKVETPMSAGVRQTG